MSLLKTSTDTTDWRGFPNEFGTSLSSSSSSFSVPNIHPNIHKKLDYFLQKNKVPHIIFHGPSGSGKKTIVFQFIHKIYNYDAHKIKMNVMFVNCAHGKGIKFIREELKFFAKTNVHILSSSSQNGEPKPEGGTGVFFKTIILLNADFLTSDAQSALRRCIELFSYNTRFIIVVENKYKLLYPILSRFCEIYVPEYVDNNGVTVNLHQYHLGNYKRNNGTTTTTTEPFIGYLRANCFCNYENQRKHFLENKIKNWTYKIYCENACDNKDDSFDNYSNVDNFNIGISNHNKENHIVDDDITRTSVNIRLSAELYNLGFSCLDVIYFLETTELWKREHTIELLMKFYKIKSEYRSEKLLLFYLFQILQNYPTDNGEPINGEHTVGGEKG